MESQDFPWVSNFVNIVYMRNRIRYMIHGDLFGITLVTSIGKSILFLLLMIFLVMCGYIYYRGKMMYLKNFESSKFRWKISLIGKSKLFELTIEENFLQRNLINSV